MAEFTSQFVVAVWVFCCLVFGSNARVISKPCTRGEFVAVVNSSRLFGFSVECHDVCEVLAASRDGVAACRGGIRETTGWTRCESSTSEAFLLQDDGKKHLCILFTTQQQAKHIHDNPCTGEFVNGCHSLKEENSRNRRNAGVVDDERPVHDRHLHPWAIVVSSVLTILLLVFVSFLCVGSKKNETEPSSKVPANAIQEASTHNATTVTQPTNHLDTANQNDVANQDQVGNDDVNGRAKGANQNQHLYVNVQLEASNRDAGSQSPADQQPADANQGQPMADQNEQLADQNVDLQAADPQVVQDQAQQPANQNPAPQQAANANGDAEGAKVPYGVVTIHSDQSNTPTDNNYAEVRNEEEDTMQDATYDRVNYDVVNDSSEVNEGGYSTVVRDQTTQQQQQQQEPPQRDRMYESVDEAFNRETKPSASDINGDDEALEQDSMYERVPDTFRQKVTSSSQAEAPELPPMKVRPRRQSDDSAHVQHRASSVATLPSVPPSSPLMRTRLLSSPMVKTPPPPSYPAPSAPPPSFPAPNPPPDDDDDLNALYARPEPPTSTSNRTMSSPHLRHKSSSDEAKKKASTLPVKQSLSYGGPRSPVSLGPLPALPETAKVPLSKQPEKEEEEVEDPGYDTTQSVSANPGYDRLETGEVQDEEQGVQQQQQQQQQEEEPTSPRTPSSVKRDGKGYALPSTKKTNEESHSTKKRNEESYAIVNLTQKRMSQRKKKETGGAENVAEVIKSQSPTPPSLPPPLDPEMVDEDIRLEPSVPPRLPQSDELIEPVKVEPPYAKVSKGKVSDSDQPPATEEAVGDEVDPYAAVDIIVLSGGEMQVTTTDREYDSIDNVMSPPPQHAHVNVTLSELEGEYASVRSDATISPMPTHRTPDTATNAVTTANNSLTPTSTTAAAPHGQTPNDEHSSVEHTKL